uniref:Uncharacterized protein LOC117347397 isoform X2 n=1 Tax=Geotrypetes seraphini TaxID=260995 RepID=A0A6P8NTC6_GEOSA|nr:uncharacterized protein LOC117347397 isoform X2 [Geotrypetes seraphini]
MSPRGAPQLPAGNESPARRLARSLPALLAHLLPITFTAFLLLLSRPGTSLFSWHPFFMALAATSTWHYLGGESNGANGIHPRVLKGRSGGSLFNASLESGVGPEDWIRADMVPLHKSGSKKEVGNYRPINLFVVRNLPEDELRSGNKVLIQHRKCPKPLPSMYAFPMSFLRSQRHKLLSTIHETKEIGIMTKLFRARM